MQQVAGMTRTIRYDPLRTSLYTAMALIAFAANPVLCRMAMAGDQIGAAGFTIVRLLSGAVVLGLIVLLRHGGIAGKNRGQGSAAFMLFLYAVTFSFAYIRLDTATGTLILFSTVQITMVLASLKSGNRLHRLEWAAMAIAFAGFIYLLLPGISSPSITGFLLMTVAGIAWGMYTLKGQGSDRPLIDTAYNFFRTMPFLALLLAGLFYDSRFTKEGVFLAMLSGGIASGIGYFIWYAALRGLSTIQSAVVQLSVPVIAAAGGVVFVSEPITPRLVVAALLILGGVLLLVTLHTRFVAVRSQD